MQDVRYLRSQAELFLELAGQMSDRRAAESFRISAAEYLARVVELELGNGSASSTFVPSYPATKGD